MEQLRGLGVPLVGFGQTVFWDEPMKAAVARAMGDLAPALELVAGVHDTDYFSKLPARVASEERYAVLPHNDAGTRGLWAATGEIAGLFGSETWVTVEELKAAAVQMHKALAASGGRGGLDEWTEAWGWRGLVDTRSSHTVTCEVQTMAVLPALETLVRWGCEETLRILGPEATAGRDCTVQQRLLLRVRDLLRGGHCPTLPMLYAHLLEELYGWMGTGRGRVRTTTSTSFFYFCPKTASAPRFEPVTKFLSPATRATCREAYNRATAGAGIYELERFGEGAIPFDLVVPGRGRGTIRVVGPRIWVDFDVEPATVEADRAVESAADLAEALEGVFCSPAALVGKALVLPLMFLGEAVMVLHEGASGYVERTGRMLAEMREAGCALEFYPILRVGYRTWDALAVVDREFLLPPHLAQAFGEQRLSAKEFAERWRAAVEGQRQLLERVRVLRTPWEVEGLLGKGEGDWREEQEQYSQALTALRRFGEEVRRLQGQRSALRDEVRALTEGARRLEAESGRLRRQWRAQAPAASGGGGRASTAVQERRSEIAAALRQERIRVLERRAGLGQVRRAIASLKERFGMGEVWRVFGQVRGQAELKKLEVVRNALLTQGLERAGRRPCAWWFPTVDASGQWFERVVETMEMRLEFLGAQGSQG